MFIKINGTHSRNNTDKMQIHYIKSSQILEILNANVLEDEDVKSLVYTKRFGIFYSDELLESIKNKIS